MVNILCTLINQYWFLVQFPAVQSLSIDYKYIYIYSELVSKCFLFFRFWWLSSWWFRHFRGWFSREVGYVFPLLTVRYGSDSHVLQSHARRSYSQSQDLWKKNRYYKRSRRWRRHGMKRFNEGYPGIKRNAKKQTDPLPSIGLL